MVVKRRHWAVLFGGLSCVVAWTAPTKAEELRADEARRFIAGKHFAYQCFDGTTGNGRISADGSVSGYIQIGGSGPRRYVVLPAGTLRAQGGRYCASLRGIPFEPCFNVDRTSSVSFRGSISGLGFAYCNFTRGSARASLHRPALKLHELRASIAPD
jgi:hypothetical protein